MRTPVRIVVPVAAAALLRTACSSTANDTSGEDVSLITEGTLTVCTNPPYEPFEYEDGDEIVGLDIDIVAEVAADLDAELAIKVTPFEDIQSGEDLNSGNCDLVASGISINDEREGKMDFSEPYFDADRQPLEVLDRGESGAGRHEKALVGVEVGRGEVHLPLALVVDGDAGGDEVAVAGVEVLAGLDVLERGDLDRQLRVEVGSDLGDDVDVETDDLVAVLVLERLVGRVRADRQGALGDQGHLLTAGVVRGGAARSAQEGGRGHRDHDPNWGAHGDGPLATASRMTIRRQR